MGILNIHSAEVRELLLKGNFGLEKESLRITHDGRFAHTPHPFKGTKTITRDFCENQTEINTPVHPSLDEAYADLAAHNDLILRRLAELDEPECLWPFSNPPYIQDETDIPIARFEDDPSKTVYRQYLSDRYGRYKMSYCGIHFNFSFADELLEANYNYLLSDEAQPALLADFETYKSQLYLTLAERSVAYGWLITAITSASPVMDGSFIQKGVRGQDAFAGMSSMRSSELGYWNYFAPVLDYSDVNAYADSITYYVDAGWIKYPSELYYPVRLKPRGTYDVNALRNGVSHIELRMIDLNPLNPVGIDIRDLAFCQLFLVWIACTPRQEFSDVSQIQATQNFKNAAHYDLKTVKIVVPNGEVYSVSRASKNVITFMQHFFAKADMMDMTISGMSIREILDFQYSKFEDPTNSYAWQVRERFGQSFAEKGLRLALQYQAHALEQQARGLEQ